MPELNTDDIQKPPTWVFNMEERLHEGLWEADRAQVGTGMLQAGKVN